MALFEVGQAKVSLKIESIQNQKLYDCIVKDLKISRTPNEASVLSCTVKRNSTTGGEAFTPEWGDIVYFTLDEQHNQFKGYIRETNKEGYWCDIVAYDQIWYMANNDIDITYEDKTLTELLTLICEQEDLGMLDSPQFEDTEYKMPYRNEEGVKILDVIKTAIQTTKDATEKEYYLWDDFGSLTLTSDEWLAGEPKIIISNGYITDYTITEKRENYFNEVRVKRKEVKEGEQQYESAENQEEIGRYGTIRTTLNLPEGVNDAKVYADQQLKIFEKPYMKLSITGCQGDITVRGGTLLYVDMFTADKMENVRGWFKVDSVTHNIVGAHHTMDLELTEYEMMSDFGNPYQDIQGEDGSVNLSQDDINYYTKDQDRLKIVHDEIG